MNKSEIKLLMLLAWGASMFLAGFLAGYSI
jgi:hypothetical protein